VVIGLSQFVVGFNLNGVTLFLNKSDYDIVVSSCSICCSSEGRLSMSATNTLVAIIEPDHTIKLPSYLAVGEQVLVMRISSIAALLNDAGRRARFAATRKAVQEAMDSAQPAQTLSTEEIVQLVKHARRATKE